MMIPKTFLSLCLYFAVSTTAFAPAARWMQSYDAGYIDRNGAYAGGAEIMHLAAHKGKLYAANGYWVDSRWVIPPDAEKQSAQVLRLTTADLIRVISPSDRSGYVWNR